MALGEIPSVPEKFPRKVPVPEKFPGGGKDARCGLPRNTSVNFSSVTSILKGWGEAHLGYDGPVALV
jgi:hypothetical protein